MTLPKEEWAKQWANMEARALRGDTFRVIKGHPRINYVPGYDGPKRLITVNPEQWLEICPGAQFGPDGGGDVDAATS